MEFSMLGGREDSEHSGVGLVEISKILAIHDGFLFGQSHVTECKGLVITQ